VKQILLVILSLIFTASPLCAQQERDSLFARLQKEKADTVRVDILNKLALTFDKENTTRKLSYAREALQLAQKAKYNRGISEANFTLGDHYDDLSDYPEALKYFFNVLKAREEMKDTFGLLEINGRLGIIYSYQKKPYDALKYFQQSAKFAEATGEKKKIASVYNNLGVVYKNLGKYREASEYHEKALAVFIELNYSKGISASYTNIGIARTQLGDYAGAYEYYMKAKKIFEETNDIRGMGGICVNLGELYLSEGKYAAAKQSFIQALDYSVRSGFRLNKRDSYEGLYKASEKLNDYTTAFKYYKAFTELSDSITNEEGTKEIQDIQNRYESEKQEKQIEILQQKAEISRLNLAHQQEQLKKNRIAIWAVAGGAVLILILLIVLYNRYQLKQRINRELEEKRREIQDSINYAKHIQRAILPRPQDILASLQCFGLYKPRDTVSGDFYWFARPGGKVLIAAADCTGHGVPGAFMSMIGIDKLNQAVLEKQLTQPSHILSSINKGIRQSLKQDELGSTSRDGMDIALCCFDFEKSVLEFAGANRPLYLVRNGELTEVKPTKAAIGGWTDNESQFGNTRIDIKAGDTIYIFTDGYPDQLGGEKGKKIMTKKFREILLSIQHLGMEEQEKELDRIFNEWKGAHEQVDDVLVIGIRV
jgi:serine phosphatase RsbU (regulator of sigma subunit)/Tfp pilus assembly protein PilF